ncbi:MAG: tetratricopeptide repeat protein [Planctomycetota bacterium]|nr:tetratricopeptide repeat protein [Planctomycetota bacterium]MDA1164196.1 tetratricopeptide repeat protein [Planctomycetota bacterium]
MRRKLYGLGVLAVLLVGVYASLDRYAVSRELATLERVRTLIELGEMDAARNNLRWLLWFRPKHSEATFLLGLGQLNQKQFSEAIASFKVAHSNLAGVASHPELREEIETSLGTTLLLEGQLDEAEKYFRAVLERNPEADAVRSSLQGMYLKQRRAHEAMRVLEDRLKVFTHDLSVLPSILLLLSVPSPQKTLTYFERVDEKCPGQSAVRLALGRAHQDLGQFEEAEQYLRGAVSSNQSNQLAQVSLASFLIEQNQVAEAERSLASLTSSMSDGASVDWKDQYWLALACLAERREQFEKAIEALDRIVDSRPLDPGELLRKARLLQRLRRVNEAGVLHQQAAEISQARLQLAAASHRVSKETPTSAECREIAEQCSKMRKPDWAEGWLTIGRNVERLEEIVRSSSTPPELNLDEIFYNTAGDQ